MLPRHHASEGGEAGGGGRRPGDGPEGADGGDSEGGPDSWRAQLGRAAFGTPMPGLETALSAGARWQTLPAPANPSRYVTAVHCHRRPAPSPLMRHRRFRRLRAGVCPPLCPPRARQCGAAYLRTAHGASAVECCRDRAG